MISRRCLHKGLIVPPGQSDQKKNKKKIFLTKKQPNPPISSQEKQSRRGLTGELQVTVAVLSWFSVVQCLPQCLIGGFLSKLPPPPFPLSRSRGAVISARCR